MSAAVTISEDQSRMHNFGLGRVMAIPSKLPLESPEVETDDADHIIVGVPRISRFLALTQGQTRHRLRANQIPGGFKMGTSHALHIGTYRFGLKSLTRS
jgi:hypothetical protein